jgi:hypothetical protein
MGLIGTGNGKSEIGGGVTANLVKDVRSAYEVY